MMTDLPDLQEFAWVGGHPALDFSNTCEWVDGEVDIEWLGDYNRLAEWLRVGGFLSSGAVLELGKLAAQELDKAAEIYADAVALRDSILAICINHPHDTAALTTINRYVTQARAHQHLGWMNEQFVWTYGQDDLRMPLWLLAAETAELLTSPNFSQVLQCAAEDCSYLFLDTSRTGKRRWCDMATCGNRAKARRYSARKRE